jgi:hypothetical protein
MVNLIEYTKKPTPYHPKGVTIFSEDSTLKK